MNSFGYMCQIRILTLTPFFTPKGKMGNFLYRRLLAMCAMCEVHE
jgi:hypothetical protein